MELRCVQRHGEAVMEEVNCTEVVSMSRTSGFVKTKTESVLLLLKTHTGTSARAGQTSISTFPSSLVLQFDLLLPRCFRRTPYCWCAD